MNKKLLNTQIEGVDKTLALKIMKFYGDNGFDISKNDGSAAEDKNHPYYEYRFYGVNSEGDFSNRTESGNTSIKTITLEEAKALISESEYPKVMWVWDEGEDKKKRVVFMEKNGQYLAWTNAETIEESEKEIETVCWDYAEDIEPEPLPEIHLTMEEIAELKGCKVGQLRIKDKLGI